MSRPLIDCNVSCCVSLIDNGFVTCRSKDGTQHRNFSTLITVFIFFSFFLVPTSGHLIKERHDGRNKVVTKRKNKKEKEKDSEKRSSSFNSSAHGPTNENKETFGPADESQCVKFLEPRDNDKIPSTTFLFLRPTQQIIKMSNNCWPYHGIEIKGICQVSYGSGI